MTTFLACNKDNKAEKMLAEHLQTVVKISLISNQLKTTKTAEIQFVMFWERHPGKKSKNDEMLLAREGEISFGMNLDKSTPPYGCDVSAAITVNN